MKGNDTLQLWLVKIRMLVLFPIQVLGLTEFGFHGTWTVWWTMQIPAVVLIIWCCSERLPFIRHAVTALSREGNQSSWPLVKKTFGETGRELIHSPVKYPQWPWRSSDWGWELKAHAHLPESGREWIPKVSRCSLPGYALAGTRVRSWIGAGSRHRHLNTVCVARLDSHLDLFYFFSLISSSSHGVATIYVVSMHYSDILPNLWFDSNTT